MGKGFPLPLAKSLSQRCDMSQLMPNTQPINEGCILETHVFYFYLLRMLSMVVCCRDQSPFFCLREKRENDVKKKSLHFKLTEANLCKSKLTAFIVHTHKKKLCPKI